MVNEKAPSADTLPRVPPELTAALRDRLSRVEGHVRGIKKMVQEGRSCEDILTQIAGVKAALHQVALRLLEHDLEASISQPMEVGQATQLLDQHKKNLTLLFK